LLHPANYLGKFGKCNFEIFGGGAFGH
jgi:hypothetical protein